MTFDEWWATKDLVKVQIPNILKAALKEIAYEAWCESRYHHQTKKICPYCDGNFKHSRGCPGIALSKKDKEKSNNG